MVDKSDLIQKLAVIDGKDYGRYQSLLGTYDYPLFNLIVQQIPKDPYAPPHTGIYRIQVLRNDSRIISWKIESKVQRVAFADYLSRVFYDTSEKISKGIRGTGYSGVITINQPGQTILERSSIVITDDIIEIRCFIGLPGNGRLVTASIAQQMLLSELPEIVEKTLLKQNIDQSNLRKHIELAVDAEFLRNYLESNGFIAFIANDSVLPRASGTSDKPLKDTSVIPFKSPDSLCHEITLPHFGCISGMGIKNGVTLIVGGGFHGKSTLLSTFEAGIYNHIPDDGREYCSSIAKTTKIRAYSGRSVAKTDISSFINHLPFNQDTTAFMTENASGSTSQAANIMEAIEVGVDVLLMDEDTCATNFMIRDRKMQQLVNKDDEPITTYIDRVKQLYLEKNISTILVLGGVGDYFDVSDHVIQMMNYLPLDVTQKAHQIARNTTAVRQVESSNDPFQYHDRIPQVSSIQSKNDHGKFAIFAKEIHRLNFGKQVLDLTDLEQLVELSQTKALGFAIEYAKRYMGSNRTLREVVELVNADIEEQGLDILTDRISGHFALFRSLELAFAINRLRGFDVQQKRIEI